MKLNGETGRLIYTAWMVQVQVPQRKRETKGEIKVGGRGREKRKWREGEGGKKEKGGRERGREGGRKREIYKTNVH